MISDSDAYSNSFRAWLQKHKRFPVKSTTTAALREDRTQWMSALSAGALRVQDMLRAPTGLPTDEGWLWALLPDADLTTAKTWDVVLRLQSGERPLQLGSFWSSYGEHKGWDLPKIIDVASRHTLSMPALFKQRSLFDGLAWVTWLDHACENHYAEPVSAQAYLHALSVFGSELYKSNHAPVRLTSRIVLNRDVGIWWRNLPAEQRQALAAWSQQHDLAPAPSVCLAMAKAAPTVENWTRYFTALERWWDFDLKSSMDFAVLKHLRNKFNTLLSDIAQCPVSEVSQSFLKRWFTRSALRALWLPVTEHDKLQDKPFDAYLQVLQDHQLLDDKPGSLLPDVLDTMPRSRQQLGVNNRLDLLNSKLGADWLAAWWKQITTTGISSALDIKERIVGVKLGLPLSERDRAVCWYSAELKANHDDLKDFIIEQYDLPKYLSWVQTMDHWLAQWLPGRGNVMEVMYGLGLETNEREMRKHLFDQLTQRPVPTLSLPETDLDV